jgi:hypothetical protein
MVFDLSAGDVIRFGDAIALTVLAVEDDLIRFGLGSSEDVWLQTSTAREPTPQMMRGELTRHFPKDY